MDDVTTLKSLLSPVAYDPQKVCLDDQLVRVMDDLDGLGDDAAAWETFVSMADEFTAGADDLVALCRGFRSGAKLESPAEPSVKVKAGPRLSLPDHVFRLSGSRTRWPAVQMAAWTFASPEVQLALAGSAFLSPQSHDRCQRFTSAQFRAAYLSGVMDADLAGCLWPDDHRRAVVAGREAGARRRQRAAAAAGASTAFSPAATSWVLLVSEQVGLSSALVTLSEDGFEVRGSLLAPGSVAAMAAPGASFAAPSERVFTRPQWVRMLPSLLAAATSRTTPPEVREHLVVVIDHIADTFGVE